MTPRLSRDHYGLALAGVVRLRAACTRRQVGAVILDAAGRVAATGYNGMAAGHLHCDEGGCPRGRFSHEQIAPGLGNNGHKVPCRAFHAERNALDWARTHGSDLRECTLYISEEPCPDCTDYAVDVGVGRIIW